MDTKYLIRKVEAKDIESIKSIYAQHWVDEGGRTRDEDIAYFVEQVRQVIDGVPGAVSRDVHYLVAEDQDLQVVGVIGFRKPATKLLSFTQTANPVELYFLFVENKHKGVGSALVATMEGVARDAKYTEMVVLSAHRWRDSWPFYDKIGFTRVGTLPESSSSISQIWRKQL